MNIREYDRDTWNHQVEKGNQWAMPVSPLVIAEARQGRSVTHLTPTNLIPQEWDPQIKGSNVLCLASGGGQQRPILAAAETNVTVDE